MVKALVPALQQGYNAFRALFPGKQDLDRFIKQVAAESKHKKPIPADLKKKTFEELETLIKRNYVQITDSLLKYGVSCDSLEFWKASYDKHTRSKNQFDFCEVEANWIEGRHKAPDKMYEVILTLNILKYRNQWFLAKVRCTKIWKPFEKKYKEYLKRKEDDK